jgi:hypothetical protein
MAQRIPRLDLLRVLSAEPKQQKRKQTSR